MSNPEEFNEFVPVDESYEDFGFGWINESNNESEEINSYQEINNQDKAIYNEIEKISYEIEKMICDFYDFDKGYEERISARETYSKLLELCHSIGITIDENNKQVINTFFEEINKNIMDEYGIKLNVSYDNYESLINQAINMSNDPFIQNNLLSLLMNYTVSNSNNIAGAAYYIKRIYEKDGFNENLRRDLTYAVDEIFRIKQSFIDNETNPFQKEVGNQSIEFIKNVFQKLVFVNKMSYIADIIYKYKSQYNQIIDKNNIDILKLNNPEFFEELCNLTQYSDEYDLYFHGSPSNSISEKIVKEGLYMQYNDINRTAKKGLTPEQILRYSYGHENVGSRSIVVIKVPKGEDPVQFNHDKNIVIAGTGQGAKGANDFRPQYIIPKEYIAGIIDKVNYTYIESNTMNKDSGISL